MYLSHIKLTNFKNYEEAEFDFDQNVNGIVGRNGSGKTNLLDAIYYLSFCKSYFSAQDIFSVRFDTDFFALHGEFHNADTQNNTQVSCTYKNGHKSMRANKKEYQRLSAHIGQFPVVMVSPYDSDIINEGSEVRRIFFDMIIAQFDKEYLQQLISYRKLLQQRNALLKQFLDNRRSEPELLQILDEQMMPLGNFIYERRKDFIEGVQPIFQQHYARLASDAEQVTIEYQSGLQETSYAEGIRQNAVADARSGFTNFGVHKDDFAFFINGQPVKRFGSQGQQKSFSLALRLAQFDYSYQRKQIKPILLLDDIFDKLDKNRISALLQMVGQDHFGQVFITDTDEVRVSQILGEHGIQHKIIEMGCILNS
ncbi:MAG: DNA replication/repair protein RecF [Bacteroidales bacterium]|nr:DNA replication/repair protein RecF [Bacteroidales bacterium]